MIGAKKDQKRSKTGTKKGPYWLDLDSNLGPGKIIDS